MYIAYKLLKNRIKPEFHPPTHEKEQKATFLNKINNKHRVISTYFDLQYTNTEEHNLYNKGHVVQSNDSTWLIYSTNSLQMLVTFFDKNIP